MPRCSPPRRLLVVVTALLVALVGIPATAAAATNSITVTVLVDGVPTSGVAVYINQSAGAGFSWNNYDGSNLTGPGGVYTVSGMPTGYFDIHAGDYGIAQVPGGVLYTTPNVSYGALVRYERYVSGAYNLTFNLVRSGGTVTGKVLQPNGAPLPNVRVELFGTWARGGDPNDSYGWGTVVTAADGSFTIPRLKPNPSYLLAVWGQSHRLQHIPVVEGAVTTGAVVSGPGQTFAGPSPQPLLPPFPTQNVSLSGSPASRFVPITPTRTFDSRVHGVLAAAQPRQLRLRDLGLALPAGQQPVALVLNATVFNAASDGFLTVWAGGAQPNSSQLNYMAAEMKAGQLTVPSADTALTVFSSASASLVLDVTGYYVPAGTPGGSGFTPITPTRVLDTRFGPVPAGRGAGPVTGDGYTVALGVPSGATAAALNVTVVDPATGGFVAVYPASTPWTGTSTVNFGPRQTVANHAVVGVTGGAVTINSPITAHVVIDVVGYYGSGGLSFHPVGPIRVQDTRQRGGVAGLGRVGVTTSLGTTAKAYTGSVISVLPSGGGYLTVHPSGTGPGTSTLNFEPRSVRSNAFTAATGNGSLDVFHGAVDGSSTTDVVVDVSGVFA
jgi:hypothetical protein